MNTRPFPAGRLASKILVVRGQKVMLDEHLPHDFAHGAGGAHDRNAD